MDVTFSTFASLVRLTLRSPREAAGLLLRLGLSAQSAWSALALLAVASALVMSGVSALTPMTGPEGEAMPVPGPFFWAGMLGFGMAVTALLMQGVGRWRGGSGTLPGAVLLVAWLQVIQLGLVFVEILLLGLLPPLAGLVEIASVVIYLWLLTHFVAELHGFRSVGLVLGGVLATFLVMVVVMALVLWTFIPAGI